MNIYAIILNIYEYLCNFLEKNVFELQKSITFAKNFFIDTEMKAYKPVSAEEAVKVIKSGDHVHLNAIGNAPQVLIKAMCERGRRGELRNVHIHHFHTEGEAPYTAPEFEGIFQHDAFFVGANTRKSVQAGYADYIPVFLGEAGRLYTDGRIPCNVCMIQVCPPDENGMVSLGTSVDACLSAMKVADYTIAVVNKNVPHSLGDAEFSMDKIDIFVEDDTPLLEKFYEEPNETDIAIGHHCAELIEDGACLQLGIGSLPNATLACLGNHKDLGIHTEMFADGVLRLIEKGVINGAAKKIDTGKVTASFLLGSRKVYDFIDRNPGVLMKDIKYVNDPWIIARNDNFISINSAVEVDLTGQVCADSIGTRIFSGTGGQLDFVRGAKMSKGGKAVIALASRTNKGRPKIVPVLQPGAGVVTPRADVQWVVTECGAVNLYGKSLQERARLLASIAHPDDREMLERAAFERFGSHFLLVR